MHLYLRRDNECSSYVYKYDSLSLLDRNSSWSRRVIVLTTCELDGL